MFHTGCGWFEAVLDEGESRGGDGLGLEMLKRALSFVATEAGRRSVAKMWWVPSGT